MRGGEISLCTMKLVREIGPGKLKNKEINAGQ
jgi:hypothetical protein